MALIVEDGTMPTGANTYASISDADTYLSARGDSWPVSASDIAPDPNMSSKEAALIRAADWLNGLDWKGEQVDPVWELAWPRSGVPLRKDFEGITQFISSDTVPLKVKRACIELAGMIYAGTDLFAPVEHGGAVRSVSESNSTTIDVIEESTSKSVTYADNAPTETLYPLVSGLIGKFLNTIPGKVSGFSVSRIIKA